jgi:hypothetical protein
MMEKFLTEYILTCNKSKWILDANDVTSMRMPYLGSPHHYKSHYEANMIPVI